jgi:hypothetical protein
MRVKASGVETEFRNPNSRNPKERRRPKAEMGWCIRAEKALWDQRLEQELSGVGFRISFGTRISNFGFGFRDEEDCDAGGRIGANFIFPLVSFS